MYIFNYKYEKYENIDNNINKRKFKEKGEILEGKLFDNIKIYYNTPILGEQLGLEKCILDCDGMCVEYGITGNTFCFPK